MAVKNNSQSGVYSVLLILLSGMINDMEKMIDLITNCSNKPISFIIIGIDDGDFGELKELNSIKIDEKFKRNLVQFVEMNQINDIEKLKEKMLSKVPEQIHQFCAACGFSTIDRHDY